VLQVSRSVFMVGLNTLSISLVKKNLNLYSTARKLFKRSRGSLGSRQLAKKQRDSGFKVDRYRMCSIVRKLKLVIKQRQAYKVKQPSENTAILLRMLY